MNSRSSVNDSNLVNFSAELSTLNQLDSKDGLLSFPFDHIYACHSDADRRPTLQLDKEVEVSTHCVVGEEKHLANPLELTKLQEQLNAFENQNKRLKDLLIYHLDLIQQQNEVITKRDKLYQSLKLENDALKAKLLRYDRGVNISPRTQALNAAYHASQPSSTVTSGSANQPTTSQIVQNCFSDLLLPSKCEFPIDSKIEFKETFGIARLTADPELIAKYANDPDFALNTPIKPTRTVGKMIDHKRSLIKKEVRKEIKESKAEARQTAKATRKKPATPRVQRSKRKTANEAGSTRTPKPKPSATATVTSKTKTVDNNLERFTINRKTKMINTYGKLKKRNTRFTGSLSDRLRLIDTTPTGEDPYQLGEADMREQSPIPKLMLNKPNLKRKASGRLFNDKKAKVNRFMLAYDQPKEEPSKTMVVEESEPELDVVKIDTDVGNTDWSVYNQEHFGFSQPEPDNFSSSLPSLDAQEFQQLFTSDVSLENLDNISTMDVPETSEKTDRAARTSLTIDVGGPSNEVSKPGPSNRGRKRAYSTTGLGKQTKPRQKQTRAPRAPRVKKSPVPGITTNTPYHTVIGDPDLSWYLGLDSDVKLDDIDPLLSSSMSTVEVPLWRDKPFTSCYTLEGTENLNQKLFEKRHTKLEAEERRQLRWHMRRIREQRHMERLRQRHKDAWSNMPVSAPSVYTVWPRPQRDMNELQIALNLPVGAFGVDIPDLPHAPFMLPWVRTSKALKRGKRSKTLH